MSEIEGRRITFVVEFISPKRKWKLSVLYRVIPNYITLQPKM